MALFEWVAAMEIVSKASAETQRKRFIPLMREKTYK